MKNVKCQKICIFFLVGSLLLAVLGTFSAYFLLFNSNTAKVGDGIIYIDPSSSYSEISDELHRSGIVKCKLTFDIVAQLKKYPQLIKPGRFQIEANMTNVELVDMLRRGDQKAIVFTFNNIRNLHQFAGVAAKQLQVDSIRLDSLLHDSLTINKYNFSPETFTAMFLPNSYQMLWTTNEQGILDRMSREYAAFWNTSRLKKALDMGLSPIEVTTLASIIEEETIKPSEYSIIAGVYMNRLKRDIPLGACPTIKFALNDFTLSRILNKHLDIDSPYNTYKKLGLPPGPIRIASINVIDAVLNYKQHDYLYFCAKSDFSGEHHFSKTLREHNRHAQEYHRALNRRKIYK